MSNNDPNTSHLPEFLSDEPTSLRGITGSNEASSSQPAAEYHDSMLSRFELVAGYLGITALWTEFVTTGGRMNHVSKGLTMARDAISATMQYGDSLMPW